MTTCCQKKKNLLYLKELCSFKTNHQQKNSLSLRHKEFFLLISMQCGVTCGWNHLSNTTLHWNQESSINCCLCEIGEDNFYIRQQFLEHKKKCSHGGLITTTSMGTFFLILSYTSIWLTQYCVNQILVYERIRKNVPMEVVVIRPPWEHFFLCSRNCCLM